MARKALELFPGHGDLMAGRAQALCRLRDLKRAHEMCDGSLKQSGQSAYRWMVRGELLLAAKQRPTSTALTRPNNWTPTGWWRQRPP